MKVKVFHLRLTKENLLPDQDFLNDFMESVIVKETVAELITTQPNFWSVLVFYDDMQGKQTDKPDTINYEDLSDQEKHVFENLKLWRYDKAVESNVPSYVICHNSHLISIAKNNPQSLDELLKIKGFGERRIAKFGDDIIALLNAV